MSGGPDRRTARPTAGVESGGPSSRPPEARSSEILGMKLLWLPQPLSALGTGRAARRMGKQTEPQPS